VEFSQQFTYSTRTGYPTLTGIAESEEPTDIVESEEPTDIESLKDNEEVGELRREKGGLSVFKFIIRLYSFV
jgi:hypothetical protein